MERIFRIALNTSLAIALPLSAAAGFSQCQNKTGFAKQLCEAKALAAPSDPKTKPAAASPGQAASALATGIGDAVSYDTLDASLSPKTLKPLSDLSRNSDGAFVLERGLYEAVVESYPLDSGAPSAGGFAGFVPATARGSGAEAIRTLLKYAELHPEVGSADIQQRPDGFRNRRELRRLAGTGAESGKRNPSCGRASALSGGGASPAGQSENLERAWPETRQGRRDESQAEERRRPEEFIWERCAETGAVRCRARCAASDGPGTAGAARHLA
jgi:hypothetical protein